jgi:hypothetical protein
MAAGRRASKLDEASPDIRVENRIAEGVPGGETGAEVVRSADSTDETGPKKPGNRVEEKTLRT